MCIASYTSAVIFNSMRHSHKLSPKNRRTPQVSATVEKLNSLDSTVPSLKTTPESKKRGLSDSSPNLKDNKKADTMSSTEKSNQVLADQIATLGKTLGTQIASVKKDLAVQLTGVQSDIDVIKSDVRDLDIKLETRVSALEERQDASDQRIDVMDKKLEVFQGKMEHELDTIRQLIEHGPAGSISRSNLSFDDLHERELLEQIFEAKSMVTVINTGKLSLTTKEMIALLISVGLTTKNEGKSFLSVARMGGPKSTNPAYKVKLDSPSSAQELLEKSRADPRDSRDGKFVKVFPYIPADYAVKQREFRDMQALLASTGYVARIEFEGTTLVLKAKQRSAEGLWCIVKGGTFRPLTTGREDATEGEDLGVAAAREKLTGLFTTEGSSNLAHSLTLFTGDPLAVFGDIKSKLGTTSSKELISHEVLPVDGGGRHKYRLYYSSRDNAVKALDASRDKEKVDNNLSSSDFLKLTMPWVL